MSSAYVQPLRGILERRAGLDLGRGGMEVSLANFVQKRLNESGFSFEKYLEQLEIPGSDELRWLVEAMTVVYTWFFRDPGQFRVIERLMRDFAAERTMAIWVAGCATGEEPYSVALVAAQLGRKVDILGTDLNSTALGHAKVGRYSAASLNAIDAQMRERYLSEVVGDFVVPEAVRQTVRFQLGNLVEAAPRAPTSDGWDLIVCRNVLIYFSRDQARRTLDMFASGLGPGRHLVLGASEAILERPVALQVVDVGGRAVLERPRVGYAATTTRESLDVKPNVPSRPVDAPSKASSTFRLARGAIPDVASSNRMAKPARSASGASRVELPPTRNEFHENRSFASDALAAGRAALDAGNVPLARALCTEASRNDPTCAEAAMFAGIAHYLDGDFSEALHMLRAALCLEPSLWVACFYQALCYENMGYAEDAARSFCLVTQIANESERLDSHPFLSSWRDDLLDVARKRTYQSNASRDFASQKSRVWSPR